MSTRLLRLPEVKSATGLSKSMIYQLEARGEFPHRVQLGARAVAWREDEILDWINRRISSTVETSQQARRRGRFVKAEPEAA